jgi:hypothetical protein
MNNEKFDDDYIKEIRAKMRANVSSDVRNYLTTLDKVLHPESTSETTLSDKTCPIFFDKLLMKKKSFFSSGDSQLLKSARVYIFSSIKEAFDNYQQNAPNFLNEAQEARKSGNELKAIMYEQQIVSENEKLSYLMKKFCGCVVPESECNARMIAGKKSKKPKMIAGKKSKKPKMIAGKKSRKSRRSRKSRK